MKKSKIDECFEQGLLKRIKPNMKYAEQSIKQAEHFLDEAQELIEREIRDMAFIALYSASFHAARALLFRDGIKERSHYCVSKYLEEKYTGKELISMRQAIILDSLRDKRNSIQYSLERTEMEEDLNEIYNEIEGFLEKVKEILKKN
ncbi:MAG: HEPN domain-containing protein [Candidatus Diapherotrites archaeon]